MASPESAVLEVRNPQLISNCRLWFCPEAAKSAILLPHMVLSGDRNRGQKTPDGGIHPGLVTLRPSGSLVATSSVVLILVLAVMLAVVVTVILIPAVILAVPVAIFVTVVVPIVVSAVPIVDTAVVTVVGVLNYAAIVDAIASHSIAACKLLNQVAVGV